MDNAETIRQAWCDVLKVTDPQPEDNFFSQAGTSLKALRLVRMLRKKGLVMPLERFFADGRFGELVASTRPVGAADGDAR